MALPHRRRKCFAQGSTTTTIAGVCTAADYDISAVAVNDLFAMQKPDRVLLRDHTFLRSPRVAMNTPSRPELSGEMRVNFAFRNESNAKIEAARIKTAVEIVLLSKEEERKLITNGGGCDSKAPVTFVSLPGLNAERNRALISVGTYCDATEHSTLMLLGKDGDDWRVPTWLADSSTILD